MDSKVLYLINNNREDAHSRASSLFFLVMKVPPRPHGASPSFPPWEWGVPSVGTRRSLRGKNAIYNVLIFNYLEKGNFPKLPACYSFFGKKGCVKMRKPTPPLRKGRIGGVDVADKESCFAYKSSTTPSPSFLRRGVSG